PQHPAEQPLSLRTEPKLRVLQYRRPKLELQLLKQQPFLANIPSPLCGVCRRVRCRACWTLTMSAPDWSRRWQPWFTRSRRCKLTYLVHFINARQLGKCSFFFPPFSGDHKQKFYWGHKEILIPVYKNMSEAMKKHPDIHTIAIIAEGIPEAFTRKIIKAADEKGVTIIGPATVGGIKPGCFKIGNTGGMLDNILASKLYRPGSVAYVSRSGGMSNELNNIISRTTDGVFEGVAIGGDRYPGSVFTDHVLRYQDTPGVEMIVVLGEVSNRQHADPCCFSLPDTHSVWVQIGGTEEYKICEAIQRGRITKPVVCWCIGTCATMFSSEVRG
ncbi:unnamed protein product, partial [Tetraodon nigroviridis]